MRTFPILILLGAGSIIGPALSADGSTEPREISFETVDGGRIFGNLYGRGEHAVVLAHGAIFDKESWDPLARELSRAGLLVLAIDFRGYGKSTAGSRGKVLYEDILAAVRHLQRQGARMVSVVGGSMGGGAAARAAVEAGQGEIHRLVLLSPAPIRDPESMKGNKLFVASRGERGVSQIQRQYERAPEPKTLLLLDGQAHAQHIFKTERAQLLTRGIVEFLAGDH